MTTLHASETSRPLDYQRCTYEGCRLNFRGPAVDLDAPYVAVLGGTETYGRFIADPFPELMREWIGLPVANFGVAHAGLSLFSQEPWLLDAASRSHVTILQVLGAQNMSNRLYSVHSRRNDRFLSVSPALREMFPDVDFTDIHFTGHLMETLAEDSVPFQKLVSELKWGWKQRMHRIVSMIKGDIILLWMSDRSPDEGGWIKGATEPLFVDRDMLDELSPEIAGVVEVVTACDAADLDGKIVGEGEAEAASCLPCPKDHARVAEALAGEVARLRGLGPPRRQAQA